MTTWSSTTNSTTSRKPTAESGTAKKTSPGTSSASATISKARWSTSPATSTTKRSCKASDFVDNGRELFMYDYSMGANNHVFRVV